jgi:hypothetical protein
MAACAALERVSSSAVCAFPGRVCVSVLQQSVRSPEVSGLQLHACASNARICSTAANAVPSVVWPTPVCAASVLSVCRSLCCTWTCLFTRALCCTWTCLSTRALCCTWRVCLQELCATPVRVCLQELCDALGRVCLQESAHAVTVGVRL